MASGSQGLDETAMAAVGLPYGPPLDELPASDGQDTVGLVDATVSELATFWSPIGLADAAAALSCLGFLADQAERRLWDVVADARELGYSWEEVAFLLGRDELEVEQRYAIYAHYRHRACAASPITREEPKC